MGQQPLKPANQHCSGPIWSGTGTHSPTIAEIVAPDKPTWHVFHPSNGCRLGAEFTELVVARVLFVQSALERV